MPQRGHRCGPTCYLHFYIRGKASVYASSNQVILVKKRTLLGKARSLVVKKEQSFTRTGIPILAAALVALSVRTFPLEPGSWDLV